MKRILITGGGRGLGLEIVRQCLERGDRVFAGIRSPGTSMLGELKGALTKQLTVVTLDVRVQYSIQRAYDLVAHEVGGLDWLINNAGVHARSADMGGFEHHMRMGELEGNKMLEMFRVNAVAPIMLAQRFLPLLEKGTDPRIINVSSWMSSLSEKNQGGNYSYCASKAALNMLSRSLAMDLKERGIVVGLINPGWVRTELGGMQAELTPMRSVQGILSVAEGLSLRDSGTFWDWNGKPRPW